MLQARDLLRRPAPFSGLPISLRDRRILALALRLAGDRMGFEESVRALREATEQLIPSGRVFFLGSGASGPIIGSTVSGVGIVAGGQIVRVRRQQVEVLGRFSR